MTRAKERIENFNKAFELYTKAVNAYNGECENVLYHLASTQSFEIVVELGWKILKDLLNHKGIEVYAPRDVIKEAFSVNMLENAQIWIDMIKDRNASSHEYNEERTNQILNKIVSIYYEELKSFKEWINNA